ncbi:MAG: M20/M25/M40 family metallo-hydrolase, partial [Miltoncostaeaceae bacterium]
MTPEERARLDELLRIPSVSADPAHAPDMVRAAEFMAGEIRRAGGEADVRDLGGHPLVVGEVAPSRDADAPEVILYGHYDVQPPGPRERWTSDPFEPVERDGNLYCRGASDDKGNLFMLVAAVQRLVAEGRLPVRARFVIDGEEESEGDSAERHFEQTAAGADAAVIFDIQMVHPGLAALCTGLRGLVYRRIALRTAAADAHSGLYGGGALNANHALARVLEAVMPREGRLPETLYAGIAPPTPDELAAWKELPPGGDAL